MNVVTVSSDVYGDCDCVAHEIAAKTMEVAVPYALPMGHPVRVRIKGATAKDDIVALGCVVAYRYTSKLESEFESMTTMRIDEFTDGTHTWPA